MLMSAARSALIVVDVQEKLASAIHQVEDVIENTAKLLKAAAVLDVPVLASEQYPRGLGPTVAELKPLIPEGAYAEKVHFSCMKDADFAIRFQDLGRSHAVVAGTEAHVCVLQTAMGLVEQGYRTFVVADAVSSRLPESKARALDRLRGAGCEIVTTEMVLFEWMEKAGTPEFKEISAFIK